jgi:hypothetical protein
MNLCIFHLASNRVHQKKKELSPDMSGNFFDTIDRINKIFLYPLNPEHPVYPV